MKNSKVLFQDFVNKVSLTEDRDEIASITYLVFEQVLSLSRTSILAEKQINITPEQESLLNSIAKRINEEEPVQYILGEADFYGRKFLVNKSVLIPRPETETLVQAAISYAVNSPFSNQVRMLDIGTGSGCIPITLALEIPGVEVFATDISVEALELAKRNNQSLNAKVNFLQHDILSSEIPVADLDIIVSNPPYVTIKEKNAMRKNVVQYEPHLALFVPDQDPLVFYKAILTGSRKVLRQDGFLAVEINESFGREVSDLFAKSGFSRVSVKKDLQGKDRIVTGSLVK